MAQAAAAGDLQRRGAPVIPRWRIGAAQLTMAAAFVGLPPAADPYPRNAAIDALHYAFRIELSDTTDAIAGELTLDVRLLATSVRTVRLDLVNASTAAAGKGMTVSSVTLDGAPVAFTHTNDALLIPLASAPVVQQRAQIVVRYAGTPASGLRIANNKHGERTFFSDNWPDRGRHWLPLIDHVADKATSEFVITAPNHYQVVSNGLQVETTDLPGARRRTHWKNAVPISPWLYVLGVARFAMQRVDSYDGKAIETYVYPQDRDAGFADFATPTKQALAFYSDLIGPFAYERLANIQASSVAGGMEAASAILYNEAAVTGTRSVRWRNVVIHEIAHQWFGNAVTEDTWDDVWLSEGFATYFTLRFIEHAYGRDEFVRGLEASRKTVMTFSAKRPDYTVVHQPLQRMDDVTTSQTYQKGSWVLHMLRGMVGDAVFEQGIRTYYARHFNGTATTADFRRVMEEASGRDLGKFFTQWLYQPDTFRVTGTWTYDAKAKQVRLSLKQQPTEGRLFAMPLEIGVYAAGQAVPTMHRVEVTEQAHTFVLDVPAEPTDVRLDPNLWVLMEGTLVRGR